jgi:hypothetical protein
MLAKGLQVCGVGCGGVVRLSSPWDGLYDGMRTSIREFRGTAWPFTILPETLEGVLSLDFETVGTLEFDLTLLPLMTCGV